MCFLCVVLIVKGLRGWKFDEMEGKSAATKKPNSFYDDVMQVFSL